jgi:hypothetical protein
MIHTEFKHRLFYIDVLLHIYISFIVVAAVFTITTVSASSRNLDEKYLNVLNNTNVLDGIQNVTESDKAQLDILKKYIKIDIIDETELNSKIRKSSYNKIILISAFLLFLVLYFRNDSEFKSLFFDKIIFGGIIFSTIWVFDTVFKENYVDVSEEEIYDIIKKEIEEKL